MKVTDLPIVTGEIAEDPEAPGQILIDADTGELIDNSHAVATPKPKPDAEDRAILLFAVKLLVPDP